LGPLPGGADRYVSTLQKCLEFVRESNPSEEQLKEWFLKTFHLKNERAVRNYMSTIKNIVLIAKGDGTLFLSDVAKEFLETHENSLLYQVLNANYVGFNETLQILYDNALTLHEFAPLLRQKTGAKWQKETQCALRLYWLRSLGYVVKKGRKYTLSKEGKNIVESEIEEKPLKHSEIQDIIMKLGNAYNLYSEKEYSIDGYNVDVVWKKIKSGEPSEAFEIQLRGNLHEALTKLKHAWDKWNSKPFLVTTSKYKLKADGLVSGSFHEMQNAIQILTWREIVELCDSIQAASRMTKDKKIGRGIMISRQSARKRI